MNWNLLHKFFSTKQSDFLELRSSSSQFEFLVRIIDQYHIYIETELPSNDIPSKFANEVAQGIWQKSASYSKYNWI